MAFKAGGALAAACNAVKDPYEMPRMPTLPLHQGWLRDPFEHGERVGSARSRNTHRPWCRRILRCRECRRESARCRPWRGTLRRHRHGSDSRRACGREDTRARHRQAWRSPRRAGTPALRAARRPPWGSRRSRSPGLSRSSSVTARRRASLAVTGRIGARPAAKAGTRRADQAEDPPSARHPRSVHARTNSRPALLFHEVGYRYCSGSSLRRWCTRSAGTGRGPLVCRTDW